MASAYAEALGANLAIVAKERRSATETEALYLIGEVEGQDVLLIDDLTETAGTLTSAAELMKKRGARIFSLFIEVVAQFLNACLEVLLSIRR